LFLIATAFSAGSAIGSPSPELLQQAEQSFAEGVRTKEDRRLAKKHFVDAARKYALLHAQGAHHADLYLNWGNAEMLADKVPQAILAYRRGLRLEPGRRDLMENLTFAQNRLPHPPAADVSSTRKGGIGDTWLSLVPCLSPHVRLALCLASLSAYSLASISFVWWLKVRQTRLAVRSVLLLLLTATCGFFWHREEVRLQDELAHPLVVIARETAFQRGNGSSYPADALVPILYPGMEGRRLFERGGWLQVQLPNGAIGWVPADAVLVDD
jgi:hypothetical protein